MERDIQKPLICHSDQGSQYRSREYQKELVKHGIGLVPESRINEKRVLVGFGFNGKG
jgi:transposase InsO family protein